VAEMSLGNLQLPASVLVGAAAAAVYLISYARYRRSGFGLIDGLILVAIMAIVTAVTMPLLNAADQSAKSSALQQNLRLLRAQIELYKLEHDGKVPVLFKGKFPQLTHATNAEGIPGPRGAEYPYGPYLPAGIPVNPYTGASLVRPTETFPPTASAGLGGWLYHQETGRIAPDLPEKHEK